MTTEVAPTGKIFTFYSYKGGTGRSMAVSNLAYWLMRRAAPLSPRVLLMDWDLEAPGLHRYFADKAEEYVNFNRPGIINYFDALQKKLEGDPELYARLTSTESWKVLGEEFPLDEYLVRDVVKGVDLIKAGRFDADYAEVVSRFNWVGFYEQYGTVIESFRNLLMSHYDYCLIDSRTGFNDISGICTMLMPEKLVTVFTPNRQNLLGVLDLARRAIEYRRTSSDFRPLSIFPLPSRIENAEQALKRDWREQYQREFEATLRTIYQLEACDLNGYFDEVQLPHVAYYSYGEEIALQQERSDALSLSRAYEIFFQRLVELDFAWDQPEEEALRGMEALTTLPVSSETALSGGSEIYISYAHIDNYALTEGHRGWVDSLHERLGKRVAQLIGEEPRIWRDPRILGNDYVSDAILVRLSNLPILLSVITPRYLKSEWCMKELEEFFRSAERQNIDARTRIFKIEKTYIPPESQPPQLRDLLAYKFYETDPSTGRPIEFSHESVFDTYSKFIQRVDDLAWDIKQVIERHNSQNVLGTKIASTSISVYLAETTSDLSSERDKLRRELQVYGHLVLPDRELPLESTPYQEAVRDYLKQCSCSIHLIGGRYGLIPEGETRSMIELQNELAAVRSSIDPTFSRIIWLPPSIHPLDKRQQSFIDFLLTSPQAQRGAELLRGTLEDVKTHLLSRLGTMSQPDPRRLASAGTNLISIYLISGKEDFDAARPLADYLFDQGYEVVQPIIESDGDAALALQYHREMLLECDACLIYYGSNNEMWLRQKLMEIKKAQGWGRSKPMLASAIYIGPPPTSEKDNFRTHEVAVIKGSGGFTPELLAPFTASIERAEK